MNASEIKGSPMGSVPLSTEQKDVLNELINIGFGRAASSLSMLVNQRILLNVPQVQICALEQIADSLKELSHSDLAIIHQMFHGKLNGHAMLLLDICSASTLLDLMNGGTGTEQFEPLLPIDQEALAEIGNIVVNAFLGAFGNLLKIHLSFTIPSIMIETLGQMLQSFLINENHSFAMIFKIRFQLSQQNVSGYLVIILGGQPLEVLLKSLIQEGMIP